MSKRRTWKALGVALGAALMIASATSARADVKCRQTVTKESSKLTQAIAKTLQKCEQSVHDGKTAGPCPDPASATSIAGAKSKLKAAIEKKCSDSSVGEFAFGRCPNETGADANNCTSILINSKDDVADCLSCLADHNGTELVHRVLYGSLLTPGNSDVAKCQKTVGQATTKFYLAASKALAKCQDGLLKKKIASCPDAATTAAVASAESKKVASITKTCCGPDGVCGGATCSTGSPPVVCEGGTNDRHPCSVDSQCPGGSCSNNGVYCAGGVNNHAACAADSECPGGRCWGGASGADCEANRDCGRCRGGTQPGVPCSADGQCQSSPGNCDTSSPKACIGGTSDGHLCTASSECPAGVCSAGCVGGTNDNAACAADSECPGGACGTGHCTGGSNDGDACTANGQCPSIGAGTCVGKGLICLGGTNVGAACSVDSQCPSGSCGGLCGGIDDFSPSTTIGLPVPCPGLGSGTAIVVTGVSGLSLLECVDTQADERSHCQDAAGATFGHNGTIPSFCVDTISGCSPSGGTQQVTVNIAVDGTTLPDGLGGIAISLGYNGVTFPGVGDVSASPRITNLQFGTNAYSDNEDSLTLVSITNALVGLEQTGAMYTVVFDKCGATPTPSNFGCVVRSASDKDGNEVLDGVTCSVTVP
jgi:hypothetical protein